MIEFFTSHKLITFRPANSLLRTLLRASSVLIKRVACSVKPNKNILTAGLFQNEFSKFFFETGQKSEW